MATTTSDVVNIDGSQVISVTSLSDPTTQPESGTEANYQDTYHIEALKDINNPLSPTYADEDMLPTTPAQLAKTPSNANNSAFLWTIFALSILIGSYYLFTTNMISYNDVRSYISTFFASSTSDEVIAPVNSSSSSIIPAPSTIDAADEGRQKITALIELAESQINQKKLNTPPSDNAMETYRLILDLDPNNKQALAGIKLIKERYQTWAKLDIKDGNSKRAIYFLQRAIDISPDEEALNLLADLQ